VAATRAPVELNTPRAGPVTELFRDGVRFEGADLRPVGEGGMVGLHISLTEESTLLFNR